MISHFSLLIELQPNEAIYTNRAAAYITLKDFKKALDDCKAALTHNPQFGKAYKRMCRCYLSMGDLEVRSIHNNISADRKTIDLASYQVRP